MPTPGASSIEPTPGVWRSGCAHAPSGDVAASPEDLAAETWLVAASRIGEFRGSEGPQFAGWLFAIARNLASTTYRRSVRRRTDPHDEPPEAAMGSESDRTQEIAGSAWVREALLALPPREREVVACIDGLGLDVASTAEALGIKAVAVRVARHRGLSRLRSRPDLAARAVPDV